MTHDEFVTLWKSGSINVHVNRGAALHLIKTEPMRQYYPAHYFWSAIWFLSFPVSIALSIWVKWWIGILLFLLALGPLRQSIVNSACGFVIEKAVEDREFYSFLMEKEVIKITNKSK